MVSSKHWQSPLPMSLLVSLIKQHTGDWRVFSSNSQSNQNTCRVPLDIIIEIAERINSPEDILSLSLTVRRFPLTFDFDALC